MALTHTVTRLCHSCRWITTSRRHLSRCQCASVPPDNSAAGNGAQRAPASAANTRIIPITLRWWLSGRPSNHRRTALRTRSSAALSSALHTPTPPTSSRLRTISTSLWRPMPASLLKPDAPFCWWRSSGQIGGRRRCPKGLDASSHALRGGRQLLTRLLATTGCESARGSACHVRGG